MQLDPHLFKRLPLFPANCSMFTPLDQSVERDQCDVLRLIFETMGTPTHSEIERLNCDSSIKDALRNVEQLPKRDLAGSYPRASDTGECEFKKKKFLLNVILIQIFPPFCVFRLHLFLSSSL